MSASDLPELRAVLEKHKENEVVYREKIREINTTRSKVAEQLSALQMAYERKLKASDQKLETMRSQHDALLRQNILYKAEIESYQTRLLEKEKIIAMLLNQRKDQGAINSSDRSKSDKTDSVNANEDDQKNFKKQNGFFKEELETMQNYERAKEEQPSERTLLEIVPPVKTEKVVEKVQPKTVAPPPPPAKRKAPIVKEVKYEEPAGQERQSVFSKPSEVVIKEEPKSLPAPPPPPKSSRKLPPPVFKKQQPIPEPQEPQTVEESSHAFFASLNNKEQPVIEYKPEVHPQLPVFETEQQLQEEEAVQHEDIETHEPDYQEKYQPQTLPTQEYQPPHETYQQVNHQSHFQPPQETNNFWNKFANNDQAEPEEPVYQPKPKARVPPKKKAFKTAANFDNEPSNSTDFFSQLGKAEPQPAHPLEIQESSIDHMDRDNSLISNEQAYFAQDQALPKPQARPVKMAKKKGKRDQIKVVDPSLFG